MGKSLRESIDNVYHVSGLKYSLLSVSNLETSHGDDLTCPIAQNENVDLWHRRLGHVGLSLMNKLIYKDLVLGLPKLKFCESKICEACIKGKQIRAKEASNLIESIRAATHGFMWTFEGSK